MRITLFLPVALVACTLAAAASSREAGADEDVEATGLERGLEVGAVAGPAIDDQRVGSVGLTAVARYFFTDSLAAGLEGSMLTAFDREGRARWENDRLGFGGQLSWAFLHAPLGDGPHPALDLYLFGAIGLISSKPVPLEDQGEVQIELAAMASPGLGARLSLGPWASLLLEPRNDFFLGSEFRSVTSARLGMALMLPAPH